VAAWRRAIFFLWNLVLSQVEIHNPHFISLIILDLSFYWFIWAKGLKQYWM
jgi:hypothetical protein